MSAILDWLYDIPEETAKTRELDAQINAHNQGLLDRGLITPQDFVGMRERVNAGEDYSAQMSTAFDEGWDQGYEDMTSGIKSTINAPVKFLWDSIPWWIWLGLAGYLLWRLGLLQPLLKKIA